MVKHLLYFLSIILISCSSQTDQVEQTPVQNNIQAQSQNPNTTPNFSSQFFLVDSLNSKLGFGYNILIDGALFIHQNSIPSLPGNNAFATKEQAELVADLVIHKLKNNIMPPSVSKQELDSLKILIP